MKPNCPHCQALRIFCPSHGHFIRKSDQRKIRRYRCNICCKTFSDACFQVNYRQRKRHLHARIRRDLCSGTPQRRIAMNLKISRTTVARKIKRLMLQAQFENKKFLLSKKPVTRFQFDELESFEHTKCKPLSIIMAVETDTRKILGFRVSKMPAKGRLAAISLRKYGPRKDERRVGRHQLMKAMTRLAVPACEIYSDLHPAYPNVVRRWFPEAIHKTTKGRKGCVTGQGELKGGGFDPIFSLNHTFAMVRDNLKRFARQTWCTTKKQESLEDQLEIYMWYHNTILTPA